MRVNYFLMIMGESPWTTSRLATASASPTSRSTGLWEKLPALAKQRTGIDLILVREDGEIEILPD